MTLLVDPPGPGGPAAVRELAAGAALSFGRGAPGHAVDLRLDHPGISRVAGRILAGRTYWYLTNSSPRSVYVVENAEGAGEFVRVGPGRDRCPVPFEISRVVLPAGWETVAFHVYAPEQPCPLGADGEDLAGDRTVAAFPLDRGAKYFLVLVALCEPRLREGALAGLPTVGQIADRLRPLPGCDGLTPRAVDFHIDYVARRKLRLRAEGTQGGAVGRREPLAAFALRFGLVAEGDLALLPRPRGSAASGAGR